MVGQSDTAGMRTTWENWSGNLQHKPPTDGDGYYFTPTTLDELKAILTSAKTLGATIRASGQRHSQPPLVADDNRNNPPAKPNTLVVDMSCYIDIGESGIELGPGANQITVNPGVREDLVDTFLTRNNLMFRTVTAGGFFSIGGMTAVDVHGATLNAPIFAETVSAFTIVGANGTETVIDASTAVVGKWRPLQFARVSLGGLGIVTRITIDVLPRPYLTTVQGRTDRYLLQERQAFVDKFKTLTAGFDRMEVFYSPYAAAPNVPIGPFPNFLVLGAGTLSRILIRRRRTARSIPRPPVPSRERASSGRRSSAGLRGTERNMSVSRSTFRTPTPRFTCHPCRRPASRPSR